MRASNVVDWVILRAITRINVAGTSFPLNSNYIYI
jgi:hypothetical protein